MKQKQRTIEEIGGFVTIHVALPPEILKWAVKTAKQEGHKDVSLVISRALEPMADQSAEPLFFHPAKAGRSTRRHACHS